VSGLPFLNLSRRERISVFFTSTQKTLGMGIPLINFIYQDDPSLYLIFLPIMIYHPLQLVMGSMLVQPLQEWERKDSVKASTQVTSEPEKEESPAVENTPIAGFSQGECMRDSATDSLCPLVETERDVESK